MIHTITKYAVRAALIGGLSLGSVALANKDHDQKFKDMDTNGDGRISADEHASGSQRMFDKMDADKDGRVTEAEMTSAMEAKGKSTDKAEMKSGEKIKAIDTDGDGVLTASEHRAGSERMFLRMDKNNDGFLSKKEMEDGHKELMRKSS